MEAADIEEQLRADIKSTFATEPGQRVLDDLKERFFVGRMCFVQGDPHESMIREGQRSVVNFLCEYANPNWLKNKHYLTETIPRLFPNQATERR